MDVIKVDILFILGDAEHVVSTAGLMEQYLAVNADALDSAFQPFYTEPLTNTNTGDETDTKGLPSSRFPYTVIQIRLTNIRISHSPEHCSFQ